MVVFKDRKKNKKKQKSPYTNLKPDNPNMKIPNLILNKFDGINIFQADINGKQAQVVCKSISSYFWKCCYCLDEKQHTNTF